MASWKRLDRDWKVWRRRAWAPKCVCCRGFRSRVHHLRPTTESFCRVRKRICFGDDRERSPMRPCPGKLEAQRHLLKIQGRTDAGNSPHLLGNCSRPGERIDRVGRDEVASQGLPERFIFCRLKPGCARLRFKRPVSPPQSRGTHGELPDLPIARSFFLWAGRAAGKIWPDDMRTSRRPCERSRIDAAHS